MTRSGGEGLPPVPQGEPMSVAAEAPFTAFDPAAAMSSVAETQQSIPPEVSSQSVAPAADVFVPEAPAAESATPFLSPEIRAVARKYGISPGRVQVILAEPSVKAREGPMAELIEKRLTPTRLTEWLASPQGEAWMRENPDVMAKVFRERAKTGGIGIGVGILGLLGAEQIADIIGLDSVHHVEERFLFIIYSMHGAERLGSTAWGIASARIQGRPFDFMRTALVREGDRVMLQATFEARSSVSRALMAAVTSNFVVEGSILRTVANGAKGILLLPMKMIPGMGPGIASMRLVDAALGDLLPRDSQARWWISTLAFFLPSAYVVFTKGWGVPFLQKIGFGLIGRAFAVGFAFDISTLIIQRLWWGSEAAYERSVTQRAAERYFDDGMLEQVRWISDQPWYIEGPAWVGAALLYDLREGVEFIAPTTIAAARRLDADPRYMTGVYQEDARASQEIQGSIPPQLLFLLAQGVDSERDTPEFYRSIDVGLFREEIELDGASEDLEETFTSIANDRSLRDEERHARLLTTMEEVRKKYGERALNTAMARVQAYKLQQHLKTLHFIGVDVNDHIREIVDDDGLVQEGQEEAFIGLLDRSRPASQIREELLALRRASLIVRVLEAEGAERKRLLALAGGAGLTDASGELAKDEFYYQAAVEWAKMAKGNPVRKARFDSYRAGLQREAEAAASDPDRQLALVDEIIRLSSAAAGIDIVVDQDPVVTEVVLPPAQPALVAPVRQAATGVAVAALPKTSFGGIQVIEETQPSGADPLMPWETGDVCEDPTIPWSTPESQTWMPPASLVVPAGQAVFAH